MIQDSSSQHHKDVFKTDPPQSKGKAEDQYIEQFLNLYHSHDIQPNSQPNDPHPTLANPHSKPPLNKYKKNAKSSFHNFQKHMVTAIRSLVQEKMLPVYDEQSQNRCQSQLWKLFCKAQKANKTLICMVIGNIGQFPNSVLASYGLDRCLTSFGRQTIEKVQQSFKENIIEQLKKSDVESFLSERRITHKKQFQAYFQGFIELLETGGHLKRMNGLTKSISEKLVAQ